MHREMARSHATFILIVCASLCSLMVRTSLEKPFPVFDTPTTALQSFPVLPQKPQQQSGRPSVLRATKDVLQKYETAVWEGWLDPRDRYMIALLSYYQLSQGMRGSVGEIGVHHGKLTALLGLFSTEDEKLWAVDLFDVQDENVDGSGKGDMAKFKDNMASVGLKDQFAVQAVNSLELETTDLASDNFHAFRFLSVDGGHTYDVTLSDLHKANELIMDGGIVALDDFVHVGWLGVTGGLFAFVHAQTRLVPFYWGDNKLFLTTEDHVDHYQQLVKKKIGPIMCDNRSTRELNERKIFPRDICRHACYENPKISSPLCETEAVPSVAELLDK